MGYMPEDYLLYECPIKRGCDEIVTLQPGKRYRATYYDGRILEFTYQYSFKCDPHGVEGKDAWDATLNRQAGYRGYFHENSFNFAKVEELKS